MGRRHSKEDAIGRRDFQLLIEAARSLDEYFSLQAEFVVLVGGRLGLRRSEIGHIEGSWVDWKRSMIEIPRHEPCSCGDCRQHAKQESNHNEISVSGAMDDRWKPKTKMAVREIPFDFDPRIELCIERFFDRNESWPRSSQVVGRRLRRAANEVDSLDTGNVYPHCLRSTAATYHAARGLDALPLQALMGWADISTARNYVQQSGENTARALRKTHNM